MNRTSIDWPGLTHTSNPGYGCKRGCTYCYARELHNKRRKALLEGAKLPEFYRKPFEEIQYFPERLEVIKSRKKPCKIFMGSMSDVCYWDKEFFCNVLQVCYECPQHTFMFLTKDPWFYGDYYFPENVWIGATIENTKGFSDSLVLMNDLDSCFKTFLSIEPLLGEVGELSPRCDLVIVGAQTGKNKVKPKKEWIESIVHHNIHYKKNILKYLTKEQRSNVYKKK